VSENGADYSIWMDATEETSAVFSGKEKHAYRFYTIANDRVGNREAAPAKYDTITTVDTIAPSSSVGVLAPFQKTPDFTVNWSATDATSGVSYINIFISVDGGPFTVWKDNMTLEITSSRYVGTEGHGYDFYSIARDFAGNIQEVPGPEYIRTTKVDGTRPMTVFAPGEPSYGNGPVYVTTSTTLYLNATDDFAGVNRTLYILDGRPEMEYAGGFYEHQAGMHNITFWSVDEAGNAEAKKTATFIVDNQGPLTRLTFIGANFSAGSRPYIGAQTLVVLTGADAGSGFNRTVYQVDGSGWRQYDGPFDLPSPGEHTIQYRSVDNLGLEEAVRNIAITVKVSAPVTTAAADSNLSNRDIHVSFIAQDAEGLLAGIYFRVVKNGASLPEFLKGDGTTISALPDHSSDGDYTIEYYSVDYVGNTEPVRNLTVTIDTIANLTLDWTSDKKVDKATVTLTGKVEPGATVLINGKAVAVSADGNFSARITLTRGRNKIVVNATDPAENTVERTSYVTYDKPADVNILLIGIASVIIIFIMIYLGRKIYRPPRDPNVSYNERD